MKTPAQIRKIAWTWNGIQFFFIGLQIVFMWPLDMYSTSLVFMSLSLGAGAVALIYHSKARRHEHI